MAALGGWVVGKNGSDDCVSGWDWLYAWPESETGMNMECYGRMLLVVY